MRVCYGLEVGTWDEGCLGRQKSSGGTDSDSVDKIVCSRVSEPAMLYPAPLREGQLEVGVEARDVELVETVGAFGWGMVGIVGVAVSNFACGGSR